MVSTEKKKRPPPSRWALLWGAWANARLTSAVILRSSAPPASVPSHKTLHIVRLLPALIPTHQQEGQEVTTGLGVSLRFPVFLLGYIPLSCTYCLMLTETFTFLLQLTAVLEVVNLPNFSFFIEVHYHVHLITITSCLFWQELGR